MQVVLLERVEKLGQMGDVVSVKEGFGRNFLLPQHKALRATKANLARFESQRAQLEARNLELKKEAEAVAAKLNGQVFVVIRQARTAARSTARSPRATPPRPRPRAASACRATRSCSTPTSRSLASTTCA